MEHSIADCLALKKSDGRNRRRQLRSGPVVNPTLSAFASSNCRVVCQYADDIDRSCVGLVALRCPQSAARPSPGLSNHQRRLWSAIRGHFCRACRQFSARSGLGPRHNGLNNRPFRVGWLSGMLFARLFERGVAAAPRVMLIGAKSEAPGRPYGRAQHAGGRCCAGDEQFFSLTMARVSLEPGVWALKLCLPHWGHEGAGLLKSTE